MGKVRAAAVAGMFYPADPGELADTISAMLVAAPERKGHPKAIIVPHAGYIYSGPVAASAYRLLQQRTEINRVVLLGPSHRVALLGIAASSATAFATPLGEVPVDRAIIDELLARRLISQMDQAHQLEHSLEVHLPFLQVALPGEFTLIPLVVGDCEPEEVVDVLDHVWDGEETLIVVSSDLSHYHDYDTAQRLDRTTSDAIEDLDIAPIGYDNACGRNPVKGLLLAARRRKLTASTIDLRNSGDTAGPRDQVVGYGAYVIQ